MSSNDCALPTTIAATHRLLKQGELSPSELVTHYLHRIERIDPGIKAWVSVHKDTALARAKALDAKLKDRESLSPLFGIPYGAKDIFHTRGTATEAGSRVLAGFKPTTNASAIDMLDALGAVMLGKTTTTEFANWGGPPATCNPWNPAHTPGGSSSGSAAALAAGTALTTLGTQTAGSLSRPAAYNGLTVLKATYGRISKAGVIPASWSLDHVGAFTHTVEDTVLVYNALSGPDQRDATTWTLPRQPLQVRQESDYTLGVIDHPYFQTADTEIMNALEEALHTLTQLGLNATSAALPGIFEAANAAQQVVMQAECASYHADRHAHDASLYGEYLQGFIREGLNIKANDYLRAQRIRGQYRHALSAVFDHVDVLVTPATPTTAPQGIQQTGSPAYNLPFTNAGVPTLVLPIGFSRQGLPIAIQLIAAPLQEQRLIDIGYLYQQATDWHRKTPVLKQHTAMPRATLTD